MTYDSLVSLAESLSLAFPNNYSLRQTQDLTFHIPRTADRNLQ